jgi:hypothetical protein
MQQVSRETIRPLRHQQGDHFYYFIPMPPLNNDVKQRRIEFGREQFARDDFAPQPIALPMKAQYARILTLEEFGDTRKSSWMKPDT